MKGNLNVQLIAQERLPYHWNLKIMNEREFFFKF